MDRPPRFFPLGIDAIAFLAMFAAYGIALHDYEFFVGLFFLATMVYVCADYFLASRWAFTIKLTLLILVVVLCVGGMMFNAIVQHRANPSSPTTHDGMVQTEQAVKMFLAGKNPYVEDYTQTPMRLVPFRIGNLTENPALYHNAYLPFTFEFIAPFYLLLYAVIGWFDARLLFGILYIGWLLIASRLAQPGSQRYALSIVLALNPFFALYLVEGRNDILILFWITTSLVLLRLRHESLSLIALGFACASKWTAWFLLPFYLIFLFQVPPRRNWTWPRVNALNLARRTLPLWITIGLLVVPFVVWNPAAFVDDVWNYPNGSSLIAPYPLNGYGFNQFMRFLTGIPSDAIHSPFEVLQWIIGIPLLILLSYRQLRRNSISQLWLGYALLLGVMGYFSHVFNDNHIGYVLSLFALSIFSDEHRRPAAVPEKPAQLVLGQS